MLTGSKVLSLACKCRARRVDEKNGIIFLVIMFTPGVMVIKMSKMAHFLYFFSDDITKLVTV